MEKINQLYKKVLDNWLKTETIEEELEKNKKLYLDNGIIALSQTELLKMDKFLPNSIIMTLEDDPHDLCYYTPDGIKLFPIGMERIQLNSHLTPDDEEDEGFYNLQTFLQFYEGYENCLINFALLNDLVIIEKL